MVHYIIDCWELYSPIEAPIGRRTVRMIVLNYSISLSEFGSTKIVVYVQDVRKKWLRENFLFIHFLGTKFLLHYTLKSCWSINSTHAAMLIIVDITLSFCVMRMLLKVIWSPGLDMQSSQGIHCRNSMLTCGNTTITTSANSANGFLNAPQTSENILSWTKVVKIHIFNGH